MLLHHHAQISMHLLRWRRQIFFFSTFAPDFHSLFAMHSKTSFSCNPCFSFIYSICFSAASFPSCFPPTGDWVNPDSNKLQSTSIVWQKMMQAGFQLKKHSEEPTVRLLREVFFLKGIYLFWHSFTASFSFWFYMKPSWF